MGLNFEKVGIIFNEDIDGAKELAYKISKKFEGATVFSQNEAKRDISFAIVVGGDGTILKCARKYAQDDVPIFGFNLGRLGFLAQAQPEDVDFVAQRILNEDFRVEERIMLEAEINGKKIIALNDMVIRGAIFSRTSILDLSINNNHTSNYLADGLIIATPTGSTAYALSAGGPVVAPNLNCLVIVAICPHTLSTRPLVVPANETITVKMCENCNKFQITADGQDGVEIEKTITIKKHSKTAKLLLLDRGSDGFYGVLRKKLYWGRSSQK